MAAAWVGVDAELFGPGAHFAASPVVVEATIAGRTVGVAAGEALAGMARLHDLVVEAEHRNAGIGGRLVAAFCARAADLGAERCFARCPDTPRHGRFYARQGFVRVGVLPRYYFGRTFLELLREPLR